MFGAIAGGIASALAGGAMSKLFGGGQKAASKQRSEERFSRNAETELVCRLLLEKKKTKRSRRWTRRPTPRAACTASSKMAIRASTRPWRLAIRAARAANTITRSPEYLG